MKTEDIRQYMAEPITRIRAARIHIASKPYAIGQLEEARNHIDRIIDILEHHND